MNFKNKSPYLLLGMLLLVVVVCFPVQPNDENEKLIPDPELAAAIAHQLGVNREEITTYDLLHLKSLNAKKVESLKGLQHAENLEELVLDKLDPFANKSVIFELEDLQVLKITDSHLHLGDITGLGQLTKLEVLSFKHNGLHEFPAMGELPKLRELNINHNHLRVIEGIKAFKDLESLDLSNNKIAEIEPISELINLKYLDLSKNEITKITPLIKNQGLDEDDKLLLHYNFLDLSINSPVLLDLRTLSSRGVKMAYFPQHTQKKKEE